MSEDLLRVNYLGSDWFEMQRWAQYKLAGLRAKLERTGTPHEASCELRGSIEVLKDLLAQPEVVRQDALAARAVVPRHPDED